MTIDEKIKQIEDLLSTILDRIERDDLLVYGSDSYEFCSFDLKDQYKITNTGDFIIVEFFGSVFKYSINLFISYNPKNIIIDIFEHSIQLFAPMPFNYYINKSIND